MPASSTTKTDGNGKPAPEDLQVAFETLRDDVLELTRLLRETSKDRASGAVHEVTRRAREAADSSQKMLDDQLDRGRRAVRDNPVGAVAMAMGLGFLVGLFMSRR